MNLADEVFDLTIAALEQCSDQQRAVYQLVHGINTDGICEPMRLEQVAQYLELSRSATRWHLAMGEATVYRHIARHYITQRQREQEYELTGSSTLDTSTSVGMSIRDRSKQTYTSITLGEGSEQVVRAARIGCAAARASRYEQIQQQMTRRKPTT